MTEESSSKPTRGDVDPDLEAFRDVKRSQIETLQRAYGGEIEIGFGDADGSDLADARYICHSGFLLARDPDVGRVQAALAELRGDQQAADATRAAGRVDPQAGDQGLVNGLTRIALRGVRVQDALAALDPVLGTGVATPDHLVWVTPKSFGCPATEPMEPPSQEPHPPENKDSEAGRGVMVAVVDTGWWPDEEHPTRHWLDGVDGDQEVIDFTDIHEYAGHGAFIAGVVRCQAPATEIVVKGFLTKGGAFFESEIVAKLIEALALGPDIINLSAGSTSREDLPLLSFEVFHDRYLSQVKNTVLVAAAGNQGTRQPFWPAAFPWSISVGAQDAKGDRADFSNFGSWVDVYDLGVDLVNVFPPGSYKYKEPANQDREGVDFKGMCQWSGTSFSTPVVVGKIAARMSQTGLSARHAADLVMREARKNAVPGVGPTLL